MAKQKDAELVDLDAAPEAQQAALPVAPARRWIVSTKSGSVTQEIAAATIEDAIRAFNGGGTSFSRKQLDIVEG